MSVMKQANRESPRKSPVPVVTLLGSYTLVSQATRDDRATLRFRLTVHTTSPARDRILVRLAHLAAAAMLDQVYPKAAGLAFPSIGRPDDFLVDARGERWERGLDITVEANGPISQRAEEAFRIAIANVLQNVYPKMEVA